MGELDLLLTPKSRKAGKHHAYGSVSLDSIVRAGLGTRAFVLLDLVVVARVMATLLYTLLVEGLVTGDQ